MTVVMLTRELDPSADRLVEALHQRDVPVFRTNVAAFPQRLSLDARLGPYGWDGVLSTEYREVRLCDVRSVWYHHPTQFALPEGMSQPERRHAAAEARCGLGGVLSSLDVLWVNHPSRSSDLFKPRQLQVANRCGLSVPDSVVTNNPDAVRDFAAGMDGALAGKTLAAAALMESGRLQISYTRRIEPAELNDLAGIKTTAHLFQRFLSKSWEARVTVVGDRIFAAAIHAESDAAQVDWRSDYSSLFYSVVEPPRQVSEGMTTFLKYFGISFGAFDFAITPDGSWIFLECNPSGAYGWLEETLDLPITSALADLLANGVVAC